MNIIQSIRRLFGRKSGPCTLPPAGWHCSRDRGHEGPCAATLAQCAAYEFYNPDNGHAIVDYSELTYVGELSADRGYLALPLVYAHGPTMADAIKAARKSSP